MMKKRSSLMILSALVSVSLANMTSPVFASTKQIAVVTKQSTVQGESVQGWEAVEPGWGAARDVNQNYCGRAFNGLRTVFRGRDQANFGNSGINDGFNQDNNGNAGNQFVHVRETDAPLRINQFSCGSTNNDNTTLTVGVNQANTGNQGLNRGFNQDNGVNNGNQVIN